MSEGLHRDLSEVVRRLMDRATDDQPRTGVALARALASHSPVVSNKLRGRRRWSLEDFFALAQAYDLTPGALAEMMTEVRAHRERLDTITG